MGVKAHSIEPYSPQQNGQVERANQEVMRHLRAIVLGEESRVNSQFRWGMLTPAVRRIMNNTVNWETGVTPCIQFRSNPPSGFSFYSESALRVRVPKFSEFDIGC